MWAAAGVRSRPDSASFGLPFRVQTRMELMKLFQVVRASFTQKIVTTMSESMSPPLLRCRNRRENVLLDLECTGDVTTPAHQIHFISRTQMEQMTGTPSGRSCVELPTVDACPTHTFIR